MYYSGQTLVNLVTHELARLAVREEASPFHWGNHENGTLFVNEEGEKFVGNLEDYTNLRDEWGNPYSKSFSECKKYANVSERKRALMRSKSLKIINAEAEKFIQTFLKAIKSKEAFIYRSEIEGFDKYQQFSFDKYGKGKDSHINIYSPDVGTYFNFFKFVFSYLLKNNWEIDCVCSRYKCFSDDKRKYGIYMKRFTARKGKTNFSVEKMGGGGTEKGLVVVFGEYVKKYNQCLA